MSLNRIKINESTVVNTGVVYDISKATGQSYETLFDALGTDGNNVPPEVREGGMSVRFVHKSDNNYVQYRLLKDTWSSNLSNWAEIVSDILQWNYNTYINKNNFAIYTYPSDPDRYKTSNEIVIVPDCTFTLNGTFAGNVCAVAIYRDKYGRVLTNDVILQGTFDNVTLTPSSEAYTVQFTKEPNLDIIFNKPAYQEKFNKKINDSILLYDLPIDFLLDGTFIRIGSGKEGSNSNFKATDFISIKGYRQLLITGTISGTVNAGLAFYEQDKNFISSLGTGEEVTLNRELVQIPVNAWYIRLSCFTYKTYEIKFLNVPSLELETNQLYKVDLQYKPNNYLGLNYDGKVMPYSSNNFSVSREIKIKPDSEFWLDGIASGSSVYVYAFYRKDGSLISGVSGAEERTFNMEKLVIPNDPDVDTLRLTQNSNTSRYLNLYTTKDSLLNILDCKDGNSLSKLVSKGGTVYLDDVNYYVDSTINISSNTAIIGNGRTCIYLGANATKIFNIEGSVNVKIEGIQFYGKTTNIKPASTPVINVAEIRSRTMEDTDVGIYATSYNTTHIDNLIIKDCYFERFNGAGIHFFRTHTDHKRDPKITNCNFFGNWYGLMLDVRSEFNAVVGCSFNNNKIGAYVAGGNNLFSACHFDVNEVGFCVCSTLGDNADHGSSCNCTYNHNTAYGIACVDVGSGFIFTSANCYQGQILVDNSQAVQIVNSVIAVDIINQQTNDTQVVSNQDGVNLITNNLFKGTYMVDSSNPIANKARLILKNNYWYSKAQDDPSNANINN